MGNGIPRDIAEKLAAAKKDMQEQNRKSWGTATGHPDWPRLEFLLLDNFERSNRCRVQGAEFSDLSLLSKRMETMIEVLFPMGTEDRLLFELEWNERIAKAIDEMETAMRRAQLGVQNQGPQLFVPGQ